MDSYTITITPNDDSGNRTTLTVDTSTGHAQITDVHLHAPAGLTGGQMPSVNVELLLQAVTGPTNTPPAITPTPTPAPRAAPQPAHADTQSAHPAVDGPGATATPQPAADVDTAPPAPTAAGKRANRRRGAGLGATEDLTATNETPRSRSTRGSRTQPAPNKTPRKKATAAAPATAEGTGRTYRKMPPDFADVYRQAGTAAAIADHYRVPRYTAQGWITTHKRQEAAATS